MRWVAEGADALYNCANPRYHQWVRDWPPIAVSLLSAAEAAGAVLAMVGNLYGYGPVDGPMTEDLRVPGWMLAAAGLAVPLIRELKETRYQFDRPFVLDSSASEAALGLSPTPLDEALKETISWWRGR